MNLVGMLLNALIFSYFSGIVPLFGCQRSPLVGFKEDTHSSSCLYLAVIHMPTGAVPRNTFTSSSAPSMLPGSSTICPPSTVSCSGSSQGFEEPSRPTAVSVEALPNELLDRCRSRGGRSARVTGSAVPEGIGKDVVNESVAMKRLIRYHCGPCYLQASRRLDRRRRLRLGIPG